MFKVPRDIFPSEKERKSDIRLAKRIIEFISKEYNLPAMLVGSIAKGTYIKGKKDMDIFILFDKKTERKDLERKGLEIGARVADYLGARHEKHYAEHPYTQVIMGDRRIDIVPAYKMEPGKRPISAVDRTPLHTKYILENLERPKDVVKLKWFLKKIGVYGAEISINGFSGYLSELLIITYNNFENLINSAADWKPPVVIDLAGHYPDFQQILDKFDSDFIVVDPVDKERNVASPVSKTNLARFVMASRMLVERGELPKTKKMDMKGREIIVAQWKIGRENEEIIWGQLKAFANQIKKHLELNGFKVLDIFPWTDCEEYAEIILDLEVSSLPRWKLVVGPSVFDSENTRRFIEKHGEFFVKGYNIVSEIERRYKRAEDVLGDMLKKSPSHLGKRYKIIKGTKDSRFLEIYRKRAWSW